MKREYQLDLLRNICCLLVIVMHSTSYIFLTAPNNSLGWYSAMVMDYMGLIAVPIFYMLSGYFILNKKTLSYSYITIKTIHIFTSFIMWSFFYLIWKNKLYSFEFNWSLDFFKQILSELFVGQPHFWFLFYLIGLYILSPILKKVIEDDYLTKYYFIVMFTIYFVLKPLSTYIWPLTYMFNFIEGSGFTRLFGFSIYFIIGGVLNKISIKNLRSFYFLGLLCFIMSPLLNVIYAAITHTKSDFLCDYLQPLVFIASIGVFVFVKNFSLKNKMIIKINTLLAKQSMGVYFLHVFIYYKIVQYGLYYFHIPGIVTIILSTILNYLFSNLIVFIISKIPFFRKCLL